MERVGYLIPIPSLALLFLSLQLCDPLLPFSLPTTEGREEKEKFKSCIRYINTDNISTQSNIAVTSSRYDANGKGSPSEISDGYHAPVRVLKTRKRASWPEWHFPYGGYRELMEFVKGRYVLDDKWWKSRPYEGYLKLSSEQASLNCDISLVRVLRTYGI